MQKLLLKLVTNEYLVKLSHLLSEGWNGVTAPFSRRRRRENRALRAGPVRTGYINGQTRGEVSRLPFGKRPMSYNGCEVIATYNALLTLGDPVPLADIAAEYERRGIFLAGEWGTHVAAVPRYFARRGYAPRMLYASAVRDNSAYDAAFAAADAAVFSFWNDAGDLKKGVHTVSLAHGAGGRLLVYNFYTDETRPNDGFPSLEALIRRTGILPILLVTLTRGPGQSR